MGLQSWAQSQPLKFDLARLVRPEKALPLFCSWSFLEHMVITAVYYYFKENRSRNFSGNFLLSLDSKI